VLFRYAAPDGSLDPAQNFNGSTNAIAGILSERGNVLGMMPHPENHVEAAIGADRRARAFCRLGRTFGESSLNRDCFAGSDHNLL